MKQAFDVAVVGGGPAGLVAATYLGRAGLRPVVLEKASHLGGRARTTVEKGFSLNLGAHAVYRKGPAWDVLSDLGVPLVGGVPKTSGGFAIAKSGLHALPVGLVSLLTTGLLPLSAKLELSRVLASIDGISTADFVSMPAIEWIRRTVKTEGARSFLEGFFRLSTYTGDLSRLSAGEALAQLQHVIKHNVLYLDGGWQSLVDALRQKAEAAGATILTAASPESVERGHVKLHDGRTFDVDAVLMAIGPTAAATLAPSSGVLAKIASEAAPARVATLDLALSRLPRPRAAFALGTDLPLYFSVHTAVAKLAPEGGAVVHVMMYEPGDDAHESERALEAAMDLVQPGWREVVVHRRFLPKMVVLNDIVAADRGGLKGRPDVTVSDAGGLFVAGDWVGDQGMLLDASLASARRAAGACKAYVLERRSTARASRSSSAVVDASQRAVA